ncbi:YeeE/YedE family protein [Desulfovibrio sp. OttesenSCG-928-F20]|nr:YeeE/YedE family protein [Desulfovibrio sp. OttesenSCG-928-M16]MDL2291091.1 YeeE/YedE family protein [Desulfovibrio sp. OttesenSCG-928-F20]
MKLQTNKVYLWGALLGILAVASALATTFILGKSSYLGTSTSFVRAAGFIEEFFSPASTSSLSYYLSTKLKVDWQFMLVIGVALGSFISAVLNRSFKIEWIPPIWRERFGPSIAKRASTAFVGGVIAMYGARLADGCPSGHGLSGMMQLTLSSFVALFLFFAVGALVAHLVYRGGKV